MSGTSEHTNRLIHETSPYLLQHAHNPVDWYPWGSEALERARQEEKLILLSIGYSACHWCHVMERESFESPAIAELMNRHFVNVKVDREERPDLDDVYMAATLAMNRGQGGWPMTVFLTPDLAPVFAGTYFPPDDRWGRPGFASLLKRIAHVWDEDRDSLRKDSRELAERLRREKEGAAPPRAVGEEELRLALAQYASDFDAKDGGFGPAPKFPPAAGLSLLLRLHQRFGDEHALTMARRTLDAMARGGIYDQVGGGFARYSTDAGWLVPHFEKMLYDNALLASAYLEGWQATGESFYRRVAGETLDYLLREMTSPEGGFHSATDADSEGEEGKFFVWTPEQVAEVLDEDEARAFNAFYDVTPEGNWEGKSVLHVPRELDVVAAELALAPEELERVLAGARAKVYEARLARVPPGLDDKVLTAWNGMAIHALAQGFDALGERRWLEAAERAADFVLSALRREDGGLLRTWRAGKAHLDAYLEDYAWMAEALLTLYEAGGDVRRLRQAEAMAERLLADFLDAEHGGFFATAHGHEKLILRSREGSDGATPAGNAVAASALARLAAHLARDDFRAAAVDAVKAHGRLIARYPRAFARSLAVTDFLLAGPLEIALVGAAGSDELEALRREVAARYLPNRIQAIHNPAATDGTVQGGDVPPLVAGKTLVDGKAALYVCRDFACQAPVTRPAAVPEALGAAGTAGVAAATTLASRLAGHATPAGTERYAGRHRRDGRGFVPLGTTGLVTSRLGFGCYRVSDGSEEHRAALTRALRSGVNLIDTSTNYGDGGSERLVGSVVRELVKAGELARDEVVVVSKIGYVQGRNHELARQREAEGRPFPEMVKVDEGLWHCLHPEFLADQLERSLDRLELERLDVCLLHNPEYFLAQQARAGADAEAARKTFYGRLEAAFRHFESEVAAGRLGAYGVSSNTVGAPVVAPDATSLADMLAAARAAAGEKHRFRVLQLPLNIFESGPVFEFNTGDPAAGDPAAGDPAATALSLALRSELAVLVNRPLNAFTRRGLLRLAALEPGSETIDFDAQVRRLRELEQDFRDGVASPFRAAAGDDGELDVADFFRWSEELGRLRGRLSSLDQWSQIASQMAYAVQRAAATLDRHLPAAVRDRWNAFKQDYFPELDRLLAELRRELAVEANERTAAVAAAIDPLLPPERRGATLSQKALWAAASTPGVTAVLSGMRRPQYVDDALEVLGWADLESVDWIYQAVREVGGG